MARPVPGNWFHKPYSRVPLAACPPVSAGKTGGQAAPETRPARMKEVQLTRKYVLWALLMAGLIGSMLFWPKAEPPQVAERHTAETDVAFVLGDIDKLPFLQTCVMSGSSQHILGATSKSL